MTDTYLIIKWLHIISAAVLFGTGIGIAYFFLRANRTGDARVIAAVSRDVVLADVIFTTTAVVLQPLTGIAMLEMAGYSFTTPWIAWSLVLYVLVGGCWLPVVWLQIRMRDLARTAATRGAPLPPAYRQYYAWWLALGWPAFAGVLAIYLLMVAKLPI